MFGDDPTLLVKLNKWQHFSPGSLSDAKDVGSVSSMDIDNILLVLHGSCSRHA